jgi:hypothetical protein
MKKEITEIIKDAQEDRCLLCGKDAFPDNSMYNKKHD